MEKFKEQIKHQYKGLKEQIKNSVSNINVEKSVNNITTKVTGLTDSIVKNNLEDNRKQLLENANEKLKDVKKGIDSVKDTIISVKDTNIPINLFRNLKNSIKIDKNASLHIFENKFKSLGKELDKYMEEIAFDQDTKNAKTDNEHIVVRNEILSVFHKSKLNPDQLAALLLSNNIYIENEKPGDWTRLQNQEIEEEMYNMKHEPGYIDKNKEDKYRDPIEFNRNPDEQSFVYNKKIKQTFY
jgi:hypothetical protein